MRKLIGVLTLLLWSISAHAQSSDVVEIYFDQGSSSIDRGYVINDDILTLLENKLKRFVSDSSITISKIRIDGYASPEGGLELNENLSLRRAQSVCDYINSLDLDLSESLFELCNQGIAWGDMRRVVAASDMSAKDDVLAIIDSGSERRDQDLLALNGGATHNYMLDNIFPALRKGSVVTIYFKAVVDPVVADRPAAPTREESFTPSESPVALSDSGSGASESTLRPLFALKTNLLYDAITALNVELEVPIGNRWSVAGEWVFPWWSSSDKESSGRNCFQLLNGNIEAKYWFGDRADRAVMTGWHLGLYAGGGLYDLERDMVGYQGEFFIAAGLSGGYAHTINKSGNLRMEYSVAVGYLKTNYDKYEEHWGIDSSWHTIRQESGNYTWIGPTRAKVSLVWMFNRKVNKEK